MPKSKTPIGAIVGGVIGGLALILIAVIFFTCTVMRRRKRLQPKTFPGDPIRPNMQHMRSMSDMSSNYLDPNGNSMMPHGQPIAPVPMMASVPHALMSPSMQTVSTTAMQPMSPTMMSIAPQGQAVSQIPNLGTAVAPISANIPIGGVVTRQPLSPTSPTSSGHIPSASVQSLGGVLSTMGTTARNPQAGLEDVISPFSAQPSPRTLDRKGTMGSRASPVSSVAVSDDDLPTSPSRARMNPPAYTAEPGSGEVQTVAPSATEDAPGQRKHEYGTNFDDSRSWGAIPEENENMDGTGVGTGTGTGTGFATHGSPLEVTPPRGDSRWGDSTVAGSTIASSEHEGTAVDEEETGVIRATHHHAKESLSDIVAGVRAGYL